jgi:hypothetical protein
LGLVAMGADSRSLQECACMDTQGYRMEQPVQRRHLGRSPLEVSPALE